MGIQENEALEPLEDELKKVKLDPTPNTAVSLECFLSLTMFFHQIMHRKKNMFE